MSPRSVLFAALLIGFATPALAVPLDPPTVTLVSADRTSVTLQVQAGASGAPAGFVVEWLPADVYAALGGWPGESAAVSGSGFSGVPTLCVTPGTVSYQLASGQVADVVLGGLFDETGVDAPDRAELDDGTGYVIRARAAASGPGLEASGNSATLQCATRPRTSTDCTVSQGYWKNHPESWTRVTTIALGSVTYTRAQLLAILEQPARGNGLVSLAHQLIATRLNIALGAIPTTAVAQAATQADVAIGALLVPPVGGGWLAPCTTRDLTWTLGAFNSGTLGPGHCPGDLHVLPAIPATWGTLKSLYR